MQNHYNRTNRKSKGQTAAMIMAAAMLAAAIAVNVCVAEDPEWDVCYEMCNQHIEWQYAGRTK